MDMHFNLNGEFLTNLVRQWFWEQNKDYNLIEDILLNCLHNDYLSLEEKKESIRLIIEGKKKLVGINKFNLIDDNHLKLNSIEQKILEMQK